MRWPDFSRYLLRSLPWKVSFGGQQASPMEASSLVLVFLVFFLPEPSLVYLSKLRFIGSSVILTRSQRPLLPGTRNFLGRCNVVVPQKVTVCGVTVCPVSRHKGNQRPECLQNKAQMHLSRNCPFSDKTNLHLELPGRCSLPYPRKLYTPPL